MKKRDQSPTVDLRTQFIDKVIETFGENNAVVGGSSPISIKEKSRSPLNHQRNSISSNKFLGHWPQRSDSPIEKDNINRTMYQTTQSNT